MLDAAKAYASAGWPVLPLTPREKTPNGLLVPRGLLNASTNLDIIEAWWAAVPNSNIGLRTGEAFDVLDVDGPDAARAVNLMAPGYQHRGPVSSTGKGWHLLFAPTGSKNGANIGGHAKLDFRGLNGYIVAPPSVHPNGHAYRWARGEMASLPEPTDWLLELVFPPTPERKPSNQPVDGPIADTLAKLDIVTEFQAAGCVLRKISTRFHTRCLFHNDDTPSLVIYPDTQSFYCFGCGAWGDALNLLNWRKNGALR